ncbi:MULTISPECIES: SDR family oxidoreductase [unclassified Streptomyces]|uniref:SDR family NAD(P)-dependent oxidoreductase n=1 Tax=unclassified Streptomyces TaxID=2593676 RepID=UPI000362C937|nr:MULTISPECIES: SDR family oxidoreductase [unclassified Streptomyces]MYT27671.1 SDR family NAD(P)-dependent oxidoreductase [Streptomyces sp. SID8354]
MTGRQFGGEVVLITGGASGIGAATARRLAGHGRRVAVADVDTRGATAVAEECGGLFVRTDVASADDNERAVARTVEEFGRLDAVVLNAAIPGRCGLDDFTPQRYRDTLRTDLDGVAYGLHAALPRLRRQGGGHLVVTGSLAGLTGSPDVFYATAKHALVGLVRSAAPLLRRDRIRLNVVCPGLVDTPAFTSRRTALLSHGLLLAAPDEVAAAIETVLADERTGHAWAVQAGRPATPVEWPEIPLVSRGAAAGRGGTP